MFKLYVKHYNKINIVFSNIYKKKLHKISRLCSKLSLNSFWMLIMGLLVASDDIVLNLYSVSFPKTRFFFDFSATYVGVGMICPYLINVSLLVGAILSWGIMWPLIDAKKGDWFSADLSPSSLHGLQGYKVITTWIVFSALIISISI